MNHDYFLVTIHVPPSLEEAVIDSLLTIDSDQGFSSYKISAHDYHCKGLSLAEQVTGQQRKVSFQMYVDKKIIATLITQLKAEFAGSGLHYWIVPIIEHGEI